MGGIIPNYAADYNTTLPITATTNGNFVATVSNIGNVNIEWSKYNVLGSGTSYLMVVSISGTVTLSATVANNTVIGTIDLTSILSGDVIQNTNPICAPLHTLNTGTTGIVTLLIWVILLYLTYEKTN